LNHYPPSVTAIQEINFWLNMKIALEEIEEKLKSEVGMILFFNKKKNIFYAFKTIGKYLNFYYFCNINIRNFTYLLFFVFFSLYSIKRALVLVEVISRNLNNQLLKVLDNRELMHIDYENFENGMK